MKKSKIRFRGKLRRYLCSSVYLTGLLALLNIPAYALDTRCGVLMSGFTVVYFIIVLTLYLRCRPNLVSEVVNFATQYATVQHRLMNEMDIPYVLLDEGGKVLWFNELFAEVAGVNKKFHKSISTIFPNVTREYLMKDVDQEALYVEKNDKLFRLSMNRIYFDSITAVGEIVRTEGSEEFLTAMYLFDETELNLYKTQNEEQKQVCGLVYLDNYEEALNSIEDVKKSLLVALIDRRVHQYFAQYDALVRKTEKDKYFVVFKYKHLKSMEKDKFSILEEVRSVKVGNEMAVTLSMGIGFHDSYVQSADYSRAAIDIALGRGGDQVVVKEGEQVTYFGGKTKQVERNTRVKARVKAQALHEIMENRENIVIMGHSLTDIDALGAAIGIYCAARTLGKKAQIVINNPTSSVRPLMETFSTEKGYPDDLFVGSDVARMMVGRNSAVIVVDTNRPSYTECPEILKQTNCIVVFDHHRQGNEVIENPLLSYIEPYASSACEMVAEMLPYFTDNMKLETCEADCIYAGILIDTNNFMTKTGVRTFEAAAYLKRSGADVTRVRKMLRNDMDVYKARAEAVRHAEVYRGSFAISVCPGENIESPTIVGAQAADELLNIVGIKASFVLTEYQDKIYVSSRSIDEINVQLIMEKLGGGGHLNVAGAQLKDCTVAQAKHLIQLTLDEMLKEGEIEI